MQQPPQDARGWALNECVPHRGGHRHCGVPVEPLTACFPPKVSDFQCLPFADLKALYLARDPRFVAMDATYVERLFQILERYGK